MDLQEDLIHRKNEIEKISAYTSLRKGLAFLIKLKKIVVLISMIFLVIFAFQHKHPGATLLQILVTLASTAISLIFLRVTGDFLKVIIDGVDLQLLANRRSEIDRKQQSLSTQKET